MHVLFVYATEESSFLAISNLFNKVIVGYCWLPFRVIEMIRQFTVNLSRHMKNFFLITSNFLAMRNCSAIGADFVRS